VVGKAGVGIEITLLIKVIRTTKAARMKTFILVQAYEGERQLFVIAKVWWGRSER
jgi:hypothetical protein